MEEIGCKGTFAGTRKTTPGFRLVEKYGLVIGGVGTHRFDLSHMIMIKDNHIAISGGSVFTAMAAVRSISDFATKIEVECGNLEEALTAAKCGADVVMLDNFEGQTLEEVAKQVKSKYSGVLIEASGGITINNVLQYAKPSVDIISLSSLVQGYSTVDYSMKVLRP